MTITFALRGEYIQLDQLLKATGLCESGGAAHAAIAEGRVRVDAAVDTRKRAKIRPGQKVGFAGEIVEVVAEPDASVEPADRRCQFGIPAVSAGIVGGDRGNIRVRVAAEFEVSQNPDFPPCIVDGGEDERHPGLQRDAIETTSPAGR